MSEENQTDLSDGVCIENVSFEKDRIVAELSDGRQVKAPLRWYPRLLRATADERANWKLVGHGYGIHWPDVDEDISLEMLLRGLRSLEAEELMDS